MKSYVAIDAVVGWGEVRTPTFAGISLFLLGFASSPQPTALRTNHTPLMGAALFAEYSDVINRTDIFKNCHLSQNERNELLDIFLACCRWTEIYYGWRPNLKDEGDNHLIELAVAGHAQCIVSRNLKDLKSGELLFPDISIISLETFLQGDKP